MKKQSLIVNLILTGILLVPAIVCANDVVGNWKMQKAAQPGGKHIINNNVKKMPRSELAKASLSRYNNRQTNRLKPTDVKPITGIKPTAAN